MNAKRREDLFVDP
uniref:Uncharacterized protein n=1 Tax=Rhodnius prolixus TaxID=13249 RepID=T1HDH3_RHOPR